LFNEDPSQIYVVTPGAVTDGLSNTALASEILIAVDTAPEPRRAVWDVPVPMQLPSQLDAFANECDALAGPFPWPSTRGVTWLGRDLSDTGYNHVLSPNRNSCKNGDVQNGAFAAESSHPGGVNVLMADGHAKFIEEAVERTIWRALGSRNNGEAFVY
jgi:prepilin-type processing-associated H-X9-DG protein